MALRVRNVKKSYGRLKVIDGVSFDVEEGDFVCLIGESGCGKTTLLKMIAGIEDADEGEIVFTKSRIGFVFQDDRLLPWRTALKNVMFGLEVMDMELEKAKKALELVGLGGFENYYPKQLSGGMRQRVGIARALAIEPDLLLMDEPFASLDAQTRERMQEELLKIISRKTVVFVTHSIDEAIYLADRIIVLSPRPARVLREVIVDLPKPRDRTSREFMEVKKEVIATLSL
jgi:NitT/TauT family transport system ATP-binding protein